MARRGISTSPRRGSVWPASGSDWRSASRGSTGRSLISLVTGWSWRRRHPQTELAGLEAFGHVLDPAARFGVERGLEAIEVGVERHPSAAKTRLHGLDALGTVIENLRDHPGDGVLDLECDGGED